MRDIDGVVTQVRVRRVPNMHALTPQGSNGEETKDTRLPPPDQPLLSQLDEYALAELIERHIEYVDDNGRPVHLDTAFVRHYLKRTDDVLPIVVEVATLPIVLGDGSLLAPRGLDRERGIVFRVSEELRSLLSTCAQCDESNVRAAFNFLLAEWLVDVATDFTGKSILIAAALTLVERSILPERPVFFVTAGRRGGGKTTTLVMLLMAVTGVRPAAAAWSPLAAEGIAFTTADNAFTRIADWQRAEDLADEFSPDHLHRVLDQYAALCRAMLPGARRVRPDLPLEPDAGGICHRHGVPLCRHVWVAL